MCRLCLHTQTGRCNALYYMIFLGHLFLCGCPNELVFGLTAANRSNWMESHNEKSWTLIYGADTRRILLPPCSARQSAIRKPDPTSFVPFRSRIGCKKPKSIHSLAACASISGFVNGTRRDTVEYLQQIGLPNKLDFIGSLFAAALRLCSAISERKVSIYSRFLLARTQQTESIRVGCDIIDEMKQDDLKHISISWLLHLVHYRRERWVRVSPGVRCAATEISSHMKTVWNQFWGLLNSRLYVYTGRLIHIIHFSNAK